MIEQAKVQQAFSNAAGSYNAYAKLQRNVVETLLSKVPPLLLEAECNVLDVGCGTGYLSESITQKNLSWNVTGLDVAYGMCEQHKTYGQTINGRAERLPLKNDSFDLVFSSLTFQWITYWSDALNEIKRVLKPGGILVVSTLVDGTLKELSQTFSALDDYQHVLDFRSADDLKAALSGFEIKNNETIPHQMPYVDLRDLLRHVKGIGASGKSGNNRKGLLTPRQWQSLEQDYQSNYPKGEGVYATWNVQYVVVRKA